MSGVPVEWYGNTPAWLNVYFQVAPDCSRPLSNTPGASDVTLSGTSLLLVQVSVVPSLTVTFFGRNLPCTMLMLVTGAGGVWVALTLAPGVPLPEPTSLLRPRCMEHDESTRDSTMTS